MHSTTVEPVLWSPAWIKRSPLHNSHGHEVPNIPHTNLYALWSALSGHLSNAHNS